MPSPTTSSSTTTNGTEGKKKNYWSYGVTVAKFCVVAGTGYAIWQVWHRYYRRGENSNNFGICPKNDEFDMSNEEVKDDNEMEMRNRNRIDITNTMNSRNENNYENENDKQLFEWLNNMPKLELHAHLHGSIRMELLAQLYSEMTKNPQFSNIIRENEDPQEQIRHILKKHKTFNDCFKLFDVIHRVVRSKAILERITEQVLLDFARENVKYLELRSTPRKLEHSGHSRKEYVNIIVNKIKEFPIKYPQYSSMIIRFILTINNAKPISEAWESLEIAKQHKMESIKNNSVNYIVGIDFAPRPIEGKQFEYYEKLLIKAREMGLKITVHFAEFYNRHQQDLALKFRPDRLGHAVYLQEPDWNMLSENPIPIEMCPTSNIFTRSVKDYSTHPFSTFVKKRYGSKLYPMIICTDDYGVFETSLTNEWYQMVKAHNLSKNTVKQLIVDSVDFTFCHENVKQQLRNYFHTNFPSVDHN